MMSKMPFDSLFHSLSYMPITLQSGISSNNTILSAMTGRMAALIFVVRPITGLTNAAQWSYTKISNFQILNSSSSNIVGGQPIPSRMALQILNSKWCKSSYTTETSDGAQQSGTVIDNGANVYMWSFSSDIQQALASGQALGSHQFTGSETLQLTFTSSLAASYQLDIYGMQENYLHQSLSSVKKIAL
jgi:hypothetical protein